MNKSHRNLALSQGFFNMLPLSLAVLPWGILCGSLAIQKGFTPLEAQLMSVLVYAGSAQLVAIDLMAQNAPLFTLAFTTLIISSRHFLYGLAIRPNIIQQPLKWRLPLGFLLTDELFAYSSHPKSYQTQLRLVYALSAGFSFYLFWNLWTFIGVVAGSLLPDMTEYGLEFAIAATFIALVIPNIKNKATLVTVVVAAVLATWLKSMNVELWLVAASLSAMFAGYWVNRLEKGFSHD